MNGRRKPYVLIVRLKKAHLQVLLAGTVYIYMTRLQHESQEFDRRDHHIRALAATNRAYLALQQGHSVGAAPAAHLALHACRRTPQVREGLHVLHWRHHVLEALVVTLLS